MPRFSLCRPPGKVLLSQQLPDSRVASQTIHPHAAKRTRNVSAEYHRRNVYLHSATRQTSLRPKKRKTDTQRLRGR